MTTYQAKDATIEFSSNGIDWHPAQSWNQVAHPSPRAEVERVRGIAAAIGFSVLPFAQARAAAVAAAEAIQESQRALGGFRFPIAFSVTGHITKFNHRLFEVLCGSHSRRAMRYRKMRRYYMQARN